MRTDPVLDLLVAAAQTVHSASSNANPWDYGWCAKEYRNSPEATLSSQEGPVAMSAEGVAQYEQAVDLLLKEGAIRQRWETEEFWGIVASLVVALASSAAPEQFLARQIGRLRRSKPSLAVMPVANVRWGSPPLTLAGHTVVGDWDDAAFQQAILQLPATRQGPEIVRRYLGKQPHRRPLVGFGSVVPGQRNRGFKQAVEQFEMICDLALLLDVDKDSHGLYSLRGAWNRPGVRGLALDRTIAEQVFRSAEAGAELASQALLLDELGEFSGARWYSADPLPLGKLLAVSRIRDAVSRCLVAGGGGVYPRLRVAARWFAEAFWATEVDDAALALGVALDALIGSKSGLPGRTMRERFALLESEPEKRAERAKRYEEIFAVRSVVAHGGKSRRLEEPGFVRRIQDEVTWATWRLLAAEKQFEITGDNELDAVFDDLRWGTRTWAL